MSKHYPEQEGRKKQERKERKKKRKGKERKKKGKKKQAMSLNIKTQINKKRRERKKIVGSLCL